MAARARFIALYEENYDAVHAFCARRVGPGEAADATAEVFAVLWRRIDEVPKEADVAWLFGIARNTVLNRWRSNRRRNRLLERVGGIREPAPAGPDTVVVRNEEARTVVAALESLRPADREILMMSAWDELSGQQIAQILGISVSAAEQRLSRARKRLAKALPEEQEAGAT